MIAWIHDAVEIQCSQLAWLTASFSRRSVLPPSCQPRSVFLVATRCPSTPVLFLVVPYGCFGSLMIHVAVGWTSGHARTSGNGRDPDAGDQWEEAVANGGLVLCAQLRYHHQSGHPGPRSGQLTPLSWVSLLVFNAILIPVLVLILVLLSTFFGCLLCHFPPTPTPPSLPPPRASSLPPPPAGWLAFSSVGERMENLAFHSLPRWKMIILPILTTSLVRFFLTNVKSSY